MPQPLMPPPMTNKSTIVSSRLSTLSPSSGMSGNEPLFAAYRQELMFVYFLFHSHTLFLLRNSPETRRSDRPPRARPHVT
jgi:hypothetical protein